MSDKLINEILKIENEIINNRKSLHMIPEIGFDLYKTSCFIENKLKEYGYDYKVVAKTGIICRIGNKKGKKLLLRSDMDGLIIKEDNDLDFKSRNSNMHACGHDMHMAILLGVCKILKEVETKINGEIIFLFQPAEEILAGAKKVIKEDHLSNIDNALMIHVSSGTNISTNKIIIPSYGVVAPSCDYFNIEIYGQSSHSGNLANSIDPIIVGSNIVMSLNSIISKEINMFDKAQIAVCIFNSGENINQVPEYASIKGTFRCFNKDLRDKILKRIEDICINIGKAFNANVKISYLNSCPEFKIDKDFREFINNVLMEKFKEDIIPIEEIDYSVSGSEDFAYISDIIPSCMINLSSGSISEGYNYPLHNPKVKFNMHSLSRGVHIFCLISLKYFGIDF